jgi:hypothetical protein
MARLLSALCRANLGILRQKLDLIQVLQTRFGPTEAQVLYQRVCPTVQASIGQHVRHSMDHLELAASPLQQQQQLQLQLHNHNDNDNNINDDPMLSNVIKLQYDVRQRGGTDEYDMHHAEQRIRRVVTWLNDAANVQDDGQDYDAASNPDHRSSKSSRSMGHSSSSSSNNNNNKNNNNNNSSSSLDASVVHRPIQACFFLSGDSDNAFELPSTVGRELGFAAHHAIHHLAMVKLIATGPAIGLNKDDLPLDFGRAPSTVVFDRSQSSPL